MEKISPEEIRIERIKKEHPILSFQSKEQELERFLAEDALRHQEQNISVTFLWFYKNQPASYMSLLTDRIILKADFKDFFIQEGIIYNTLTALKIGRLCVDDAFVGRGLGRLMIYAAIEKAKEISKNIAGCRCLTVDSKKDSVGFYERMGFCILKETRHTTTYLDIRRINQHN